MKVLLALLLLVLVFGAAHAQFMIGKDSVRLASYFRDFPAVWTKEKVVYTGNDKLITCYRNKEGKVEWYSITYPANDPENNRRRQTKNEDVRICVTVIDEKDGSLTIEFKGAK